MLRVASLALATGCLALVACAETTPVSSDGARDSVAEAHVDANPDVALGDSSEGITPVDSTTDGTVPTDAVDDAGDAGDAMQPTFPAPPTPSGDVHEGDTGFAVDELQFELKLATGQRLDEDGAFGPLTLGLLNTFQTSAGLPTSNVADATTRMALGMSAASAASALILDYGMLPDPLDVPPAATIAATLASTMVIPGEGDRTGMYMGMTGFNWGDGAESTSITQGSPAHILWVASDVASESVARVIGTISRNEGPFDAVNSYDAGEYTWGAYQLIGAYKYSPYLASEDELANGLAYAKISDPAAFWHAFQRYGVDVAFDVGTDGRVVPSSVDVTLTQGDGTVLHGKDVWATVGTDSVLNQVFIDAGQDPRIQRTEIIGAIATHFDVLDLPLSTTDDIARAYFTSERAVTAFLDMELNQGRGTAQRAYAAAVDTVSTSRGIDPAHPATWPATDRTAIEADILQSVLANLTSSTYAARMQRVLASYFPSDAAGSFLP